MAVCPSNTRSSFLRITGFKRPLEGYKLLTRWAFEYFDQTGHFERGLIEAAVVAELRVAY